MRPIDRRSGIRTIGLLAAAGVIASAGCVSALREPPPLEDIAADARAAGSGRFAEADQLWSQRTLESVQDAANRYQAAVTDESVQLEALLGATHCRIWLADHSTDPEERLSQAVEAINLAQWCGRVAPDEAECDYLLALGLGLQAQERRTTVIDGLPRVVSLLQSAVERAPRIDNAGPHRVLALVYLRAPGWPAGPGDIELGREQARRAVQLDPGYPPNQMALGEAHRELDEIEKSRTAYAEAERLAIERVAQKVPDAQEWLDLARHALERLEQR
jgi:tetratricopeptide (TPR) repeat protein